MLNQKQSLGRRAEEAACRFLRDKGFTVIARNYRTRFAEIDIIAKDKDIVCFVEVKARSSDRLGLPQESVLGNKQAKICRAATAYLAEHKLLEARSRFDVVAVFADNENLRCELIKEAFSAQE